MLFQFNSNNQVDGTEDVAKRIEEVVRRKVNRIASHIMRVEVHFGDVNATKGGVDKRARVELRPALLAPVASSDTTDTIDLAAASATDKALVAFDRVIGKRQRAKATDFD